MRRSNPVAEAFANLFGRLFGFVSFAIVAVFVFHLSGSIDTKNADLLGIYDFTAISANRIEHEDDDGTEITYELTYQTEDEKYTFYESVSYDTYQRFNSDKTYRPVQKRSVWTNKDGYDCMDPEILREEVLAGRQKQQKLFRIISGVALGLGLLFFLPSPKKKRRRP